MTSMDEFFGNYLKTDDIKKETTTKITEVKVEPVGRDNDKHDKIVLYFADFDKGLIVNKVNGEILADIFKSREIETWNNKEVTLYVDQSVMFGSKRVGGVRIKVPSKSEVVE